MTDSSPIRLAKAPKNLPADWTPPVPAFSGRFDPALAYPVFAYLGIQDHDGRLDAAQLAVAELLGADTRPLSVEWAEFLDPSGHMNRVAVTYWKDRETFRAWHETGTFADWWRDEARLDDGVGYWLEAVATPLERFETLFSGSDRPAGICQHAEAFEGPVLEHGYWGAAKDRITLSGADQLASSLERLSPDGRNPDALGRRLKVPAPENVCLIRSGQDPTDCAGEELEEYLSDLQPLLIAGLSYLASHPAETGCFSSRFMHEVDAENRRTGKTFGWAFWQSIDHMGRWAQDHPTHLAIFNRFLEIAEARGADIRLRLWHEVSVPQAEDCVLEYINCHPKTGFLPFLDAEDFPS